MEAKLVVIRGADAVEVELFLPFLIGRSSDAALKIPHESVSREHCRIYEFDGELAVRDLGSRNGTYVNGERIDRPTFLSPGDELTVGKITFRADYQIRRQVVLVPHAEKDGVRTKISDPDDETNIQPPDKKQAAVARQQHHEAKKSKRTIPRKSGEGKAADAKPKASKSSSIPAFENKAVDLPTSIPDLGLAPPGPSPDLGEVELDVDGPAPVVSEDELKDFLQDLD